VLGRGGGDVHAADEGDDAEVLEAGVIESVVGLDALGRGIVRSVGVEAAGDAGAEGARDQGADHGRDHDGAASAGGEVG
jgi:hypothetical protein